MKGVFKFRILSAAAFAFASISFGQPARPVMVAPDAVLGDRLVVEVNGTAFTQRQIEIYDLVRQTLGSKAYPFELGASPAASARDASWRQTLSAFITDILMQQDVRRLGSFVPGPETITRTVGMYEHQVDASPSLAARARGFGVDAASLRQATSLLLQAESYKRATLKADEERGHGTGLAELRTQATIVYFKDAWLYKMIHPSSEASPEIMSTREAKEKRRE